MKLEAFRRTTVKVSADWKPQYAQGGLILFYPAEDSLNKSGNPPQWIKTGIEFEDNKTFAAVVASNPWSDWSLQRWNSSSLTVEAIRENNKLRIYALDGDEKLPLREITWAFDGQDHGKDIQVGVYVAMPKGLEDVEGGGTLSARFDNFIVESL
ncbi:MAG: hypothetical protein M1821_000066 [Bathelium mastoideum]|nr:MAG: hypothetical protein M1821_000066 [Bathelium mastoideum]